MKNTLHMTAMRALMICGLVGAEDGDGVGVERHRDGRQVEPVPGLEEGGEDGPVPAVDAVEVAEGDDARAQGLGRR